MKKLKILFFSLSFTLINIAVTFSSSAMQIEDSCDIEDPYEKSLIESQKIALQGVVNAQKEQIRYLKVVVDILTPRDDNINSMIEFLNEFHCYSWPAYWSLFKRQNQFFKNSKEIRVSKKIREKFYSSEQKKYQAESFRIYRGYLLNRLVLQNIAQSLLYYNVTNKNFEAFKDLYRLYILEVKFAITGVANRIHSLQDMIEANLVFLQEELCLLSGMQETLVNGLNIQKSFVDRSINKDLSLKIVNSSGDRKLTEDLKKIHQKAQQPGLENIKEAKTIASELSIKIVINGKDSSRNWGYIIDRIFSNDFITLIYPSLNDQKLFDELLADLFISFSSIDYLIKEEEVEFFLKKNIPEKIESITKRLYPTKIKKHNNKLKKKKSTRVSKKNQENFSMNPPAEKKYNILEVNNEEKTAEQEINSELNQDSLIQGSGDQDSIDQDFFIEYTSEHQGHKERLIQNPKYLRLQAKASNFSLIQPQISDEKLFKPGEIKFFDEILFAPFNVSNAYCWNDIVSLLTECNNPSDKWRIETKGNGSARQFIPPKRLHDILGSHHITVHAPHDAREKPMPMYSLKFLRSGFRSYGLIYIEKGTYTTQKNRKR